MSRATLDADIVARLEAQQAGRFAKELGSEFTADIDAIADAAERRSSFSVIHIADLLDPGRITRREHPTRAGATR